MTDIIIAVVVLIIVGLAVRYIYKAKKNGVRCIGCPHSKNCSAKGCNCGK